MIVVATTLGDDIWQNQLPTVVKEDTNDQINDALQSKQETLQKRKADNSECNQQPHLRAICQYNNDINDCCRLSI